MKKIVAVLAAAGLAGVACANEIDQNQPNGPVYMAGFSQTDLAQSFQTQSAPNITGAGILLQAGVGSSDTVTIELWDALPNAGGTMLATASEIGTEGQWVDVFWDAVDIQANTTYYLVFTGNTTLGIAGDTANPYPHGHVFANPGYGPFPTFDYAFRTWTGESGCAADLDGDGDADVNDFFLYLDLFEAGDPRADITGDGDVDVNDFFAYLDLFEQGC